MQEEPKQQAYHVLEHSLRPDFLPLAEELEVSSTALSLRNWRSRRNYCCDRTGKWAMPVAICFFSQIYLV